MAMVAEQSIAAAVVETPDVTEEEWVHQPYSHDPYAAKNKLVDTSTTSTEDMTAAVDTSGSPSTMRGSEEDASSDTTVDNSTEHAAEGSDSGNDEALHRRASQTSAILSQPSTPQPSSSKPAPLELPTRDDVEIAPVQLQPCAEVEVTGYISTTSPHYYPHHAQQSNQILAGHVAGHTSPYGARSVSPYENARSASPYDAYATQGASYEGYNSTGHTSPYNAYHSYPAEPTSPVSPYGHQATHAGYEVAEPTSPVSPYGHQATHAGYGAASEPTSPYGVAPVPAHDATAPRGPYCNPLTPVDATSYPPSLASYDLTNTSPHSNTSPHHGYSAAGYAQQAGGYAQQAYVYPTSPTSPYTTSPTSSPYASYQQQMCFDSASMYPPSVSPHAGQQYSPQYTQPTSPVSPYAQSAPTAQMFSQAVQQQQQQQQVVMLQPLVPTNGRPSPTYKSQAQAQPENTPSAERSSMWRLIVEFKRGRTANYEAGLCYSAGEYVIVEGDGGNDMGIVVETEAVESEGERGRKKMQKVLRRATEKEVHSLHVAQADAELRCVELAREKVRQRRLNMTVVDAEFQFDRKKVTFYYDAPHRIDFRELVRELYKVYRARIWMCNVNEVKRDEE